MKDIHEVLRAKQARHAQLTKQIEALQQAAEKLREVAPLLADNDDEDNVVLGETEDSQELTARAATATAASTTAPAAKPVQRGTAPRWP